MSPIHQNTYEWNKTKLILYRSISDENLHIPQEINVYISGYIKQIKAQKKLSLAKYSSSGNN